MGAALTRAKSTSEGAANLRGPMSLPGHRVETQQSFTVAGVTEPFPHARHGTHTYRDYPVNPLDALGRTRHLGISLPLEGAPGSVSAGPGRSGERRRRAPPQLRCAPPARRPCSQAVSKLHGTDHREIAG